MTTADETPVWFLDVDGVINAITYALPPGFEQGEASPGGDYERFTIKWNPAVIARINQLHDDKIVQVRWLTTWGSGANGELRELVGINELEVQAEPPLYAGGGYRNRLDHLDDGFSWWKLQVVNNFREDCPGRKIIWTDDDINVERDAVTWIKNDPLTYGVCPLQHKTLSLREIDAIEKFAKGLPDV